MAMKKLLISSLLFGSATVYGADNFVVNDIHFEGLQRLDFTTVLQSIPIHLGDIVNDNIIRKTIRYLFDTGKFENIEILHDGTALIIHLKERPIIASVNFIGNKILKEDRLRLKLESLHVNKGEFFNPLTVSLIKQNLEKLYYSIGNYNATIKTVVKSLPNNSVNLKLIFQEGIPAKIKQINILGNKDFTSDELISHFHLHDVPSILYSSTNNKFNKDKLAQDLNELRKFYWDRGYAHFNIDGVYLNLSPDKKEIFITIKITEGNKYKISNITVHSNLPDHAAEIEKLITISSGKFYNNSKISQIEENIKKLLSRYGYAYPKILTHMEVNDKDKTIKLHVNVESGNLYYVHNITFKGNTKTRDVVLRREVHQMEGAWLNIDLVEEGAKRLERTGYFDTVTTNIYPIPGTIDQVEVIYNIQEHDSGTFHFGLGYGGGTNINLQVGMLQANWLGTGNIVNISAKKSIYNKYIELTLTKPYVTINGLSISGNLLYNDSRANKNELSEYDSKRYAITGTVAFPLSEHNLINFGLGYDSETISNIPSNVAMLRYLRTINNKNQIDKKGQFFANDLTFQYSWRFNTLNRITFPTSGSYISLNGKITTPVSHNAYHKTNIDLSHYVPLNEKNTWVILARGHLGYGNGLGNKEMPFYENFFAGGVDTIRGFQNNTIGPKAVYLHDDLSKMKCNICQSNDAIGGNAMAIARIELITPTPLLNESYADILRTSFFIDAGTVWDTRWKSTPELKLSNIYDYSSSKDIRVSLGASLQWISPFGPVAFSYSKALKSFKGDKWDGYQFNFVKTW